MTCTPSCRAPAPALAPGGTAAGTSAAKEGKSKNKHAISGAKIEFCTAMDKQLFMSTIKRLRDASMV